MHFKMSSAICFNLEQSKILSSGNGLNGLSDCDYYPLIAQVIRLALYFTCRGAAPFHAALICTDNQLVPVQIEPWITGDKRVDS